MGAQKVGATPGALDGEVLDGVLGDAEEPGNFLLGVALDFAEEDHFALAFGEGIDGFREQGQFLGVAQGFDGAPLFGQDREIGVFRYHHMVGAGAEGKEIAHGVAGDGEEERLGGADPVARLGAQQAEVGLLGGIVGIGWARQGFAEVGAEGMVMGLHLPGEPCGMVRVGTGAGSAGNGRIGMRLAQGEGDRQAVSPASGAKSSRPHAANPETKLFR